MENSESQFALISQFLKLLSSSKKKRLFETLKKEENITLNPKQIHLPVSELLDEDDQNLIKLESSQNPSQNQTNNIQEITYDKIDENSPNPTPENINNTTSDASETPLDDETNTPSKSIKKKVWTKKSRLKIAVEAIQENNNSKIARNHGISESTIRKWRIKLKNEPDVQKAVEERKKLKRKRRGIFSLIF